MSRLTPVLASSTARKALRQRLPRHATSPEDAAKANGCHVIECFLKRAAKASSTGSGFAVNQTKVLPDPVMKNNSSAKIGASSV